MWSKCFLKVNLIGAPTFVFLFFNCNLQIMGYLCEAHWSKQVFVMLVSLAALSPLEAPRLLSRRPLVLMVAFSQVISVGKSAPLDGVYKIAICTAMRIFLSSWWRHQMETFSALLALCAGNSPVLGEFPAQWPVTRSCCAFCDVRLNKRLSKQSWGWWFETLSRPLWRHRNDDDCIIR